MPQDTPDAVDPLASFEGSADLPELGLTRRWFDARDITEEQRTQIFEVLRAAFNEDVSWFALPVRPEDHFDWKYRDRPTGVTLSLMLERDGRVVDFIASVRRVWYVEGEPIVMRSGTDLARIPEWQGRGLQRAVLGLVDLESHPAEAYSFGYATHPRDRSLSLDLGDKVPANETHDYFRRLRLQPLRHARELADHARKTVRTRRPATRTIEESAPARISNTSRVIRERARSGRDRARDFAVRARRSVLSLLARRPAPPPGDWTISTIDRFEDRHEPFISEAIRQFDFVGDRSVTYLNWRFCDERAGPFTIRLLQGNSGDRASLGYAVTRVHNGSAALADILALPGRTDVAEALIRDAIDLARDGGAAVITARLPRRHAYQRGLARNGFADSGQLGGEIASDRHARLSELPFLERADAKIHLTLADSDMV